MCLSDTSSLSGATLAILFGRTLFFKWSNVTFRTEGTDGLEDLETEKWPVANSKGVAWTTNSLTNLYIRTYERLIHHTMPHIPHHNTPHHTTPHHTTLHHTTPHHTTSHYITLHHTTPHIKPARHDKNMETESICTCSNTWREKSSHSQRRINEAPTPNTPEPRRTTAEQGHPHLAAPPTLHRDGGVKLPRCWMAALKDAASGNGQKQSAISSGTNYVCQWYRYVY